jgi:hypothetical protein
VTTKRRVQPLQSVPASPGAELDNEYPFLNAMTLVALYSALDPLVEDLAPEVFKFRVRLQGSAFVRKAAQQHSSE